MIMDWDGPGICNKCREFDDNLSAGWCSDCQDEADQYLSSLVEQSLPARYDDDDDGGDRCEEDDDDRLSDESEFEEDDDW
jgi:hypothetical protein